MANARYDIDIGGGEGAEEPLIIEGEQEDTGDGHKVGEHLLVVPIPTLEREMRFVERTFAFNCNNMPTSFYIRVTFTGNLEVSALTTLKRTDGGPGLVEVRLCTTVGHFQPEACAWNIFPRVRSGPLYSDTTNALITTQDARNSVGMELDLHLHLAVRGCHGALELDTSDSEDSISTLSEYSSSTHSEDSSKPIIHKRKRRETMDTSDAVEAPSSKRSRMQSS